MNGYIFEITDSEFIGRMRGNPLDYEITYKIVNLPKIEKKYVKMGAIFEFNEKTGKIVFSKKAAFTKKELAEAKKRADDLINNIKWE